MAAAIVRATAYGVHTEQYLQTYRQEFLLIVQIETREAVEHVERIAAVDGVDCVFIGPYDLSGSLGYTGQPEHKDTRAAIRKINQAVKRAGKPLSTLTNPARNARKLFAEGYELVFSGSDIGMLRQAMQQDADNCHKMLQGLAGNR
jgi:2-keto-3-deoxy-L-rhamnonate aldolase RhmA